MSIFSKSFDEKVRNQLKIREQILASSFTGLSGESSILGNRSSAYFQYANNKTPFIRLSSGVNVVNPILQNYFGLSQPDELATRFILEGGTLLSNSNQNDDAILSTQRSSFLGNSSVYGAQDLGGRSDLGIRPMPGITGMSIKSYGDKIAALRIATVTIEAFTIQQLEALEILYMRPGYRVLLEWGNNSYFSDPNSDTPEYVREAIDIIKLDKRRNDIFSKIFQYREQTQYSYDGLLGKVRNFSWEAQTNGSYRCTVEIISLGDIIDSLKIDVAILKKENGTTDSNTDSEGTEEATNAFLALMENIKISIDKQKYKSILNISYKDLYKPIANSPGVANSNRNLDNEIQLLSVKTTEPAENDKSDNRLRYIRLQDLVNIINDTCIYLENDTPIIKIDENLGQCRSHPLQISADPFSCLISPYRISEGIRYGYGRDNNGLNTILSNNFPYRNPDPLTPSDDMLFKGNIGEILIELEHIINTFKSLIKSEENEYNVYLKDFIQTLLNSVNNSTGFVNDLVLTQSPNKDDELIIMDANLTEATVNNADSYYTIPLMGIGRGVSDDDSNELGGTYVRSYRLNTQLTNNIATIVSINAQADFPSSIDGYKNSVFNTFNQGIKDRIFEEPIQSATNPTPTSGSQVIDGSSFIIDLKNDLEKIGRMVTLTPSDVIGVKNNLKRAIDYINSKDFRITTAFGCYTPVPLKLTITMDGISGLKIGQIFTVPADRLPLQYKIFDPRIYGKENIGKPRVGFIIFGINQNVSSNEGWTTELDCQMVMLNPQSNLNINYDDYKLPLLENIVEVDYGSGLQSTITEDRETGEITRTPQTNQQLDRNLPQILPLNLPDN